MPVVLYNSLTRMAEPFVPIDAHRVGVYSCGPTVYSSPSIGNFRAFLFADTLVRVLRYNGFTVSWVMNITDVGHLVSDADEGEDKLQASAQREGKTAWDVARRYTDEFLRDLDALNITRPDIMPKATDHIAEQVRLVEELEQRGHTYRTTDGIYFDTATFADYGVMAGQNLEEKQTGARVGVNVEKRHPADFALWKFSPAGARRDMEWDAPWGLGFPGWHLECSAMSMKYLGDLYDIHTGGADLRGIHHANEIAQAFGARGTREANMWMHNAFLQVDGGKMSKSLGNVYTVADLKARGYDPLAFRYFTLQAQYRHPLNFTFEALDAAAAALKKLQAAARLWDKPAAGSPEYEEQFLQAVNDDLNMPQALSIVWDMVHDTRVPSAAKAQTLKKFDAVLGLDLARVIAVPLIVSDDIQELVAQREEARSRKDFSAADALRAQILQKGFVVEDTPEGPRVTPV